MTKEVGKKIIEQKVEDFEKNAVVLKKKDMVKPIYVQIILMFFLKLLDGI